MNLKTNNLKTEQQTATVGARPPHDEGQYTLNLKKHQATQAQAVSPRSYKLNTHSPSCDSLHPP